MTGTAPDNNHTTAAGASSGESGPQRAPLPEQQVRLMSAVVLLLGIGVFLALPFVLSIGSIVFLPIVSALLLTILLSPMADWLTRSGIPNVLASLLSLLVFFGALVAALALILQPAAELFDTLPAIVERIGERFAELRDQFAWVSGLNDQMADVMGDTEQREVVLAGPSMLEEIAFATPTVVVQMLVMFLMAFFMIEARVRMRRRLLFDRESFGSSVRAARAIREVQDRVAAYIITVSMINAGLGVVVGLGAWMWGLDEPIMWGGLAMILNFIPYIGPLALMALLAVFGLGTADTVFLGLVPAMSYMALNAIEGNAVTPSILGARFTMSPVMILITLSYFTWIWGAVGALLSVPILLTVTSLFEHIGKPNVIGFLFGEPLFTGEVPESAVNEGQLG